MLKPQSLLTLFMCVLTQSFYAQDVNISQYFQSPTTINPAYAGTAGGIRALAGYKNQWSSISSPYKTLYLFSDANITKKLWNNAFVGAGLHFTSDKAGTLEYGTTNMGGSVSSGIQLTENSGVSLGIQVNYQQRSMNTSNLQSDLQYINGAYDPSAALGENFSGENISNLNFGAGVQYTMGHSENYKLKNGDLSFTAGASYFNLTKSNVGFISDDPVYGRFVLNGSGHISSNIRSISVVPSLVWVSQGPSSEFVIGAMLRNKLKENSRYTNLIKSSSLSFGSHLRVKDALILSLLYENSGYGFGISYDINTSPLREASGGKGGFEISIKFVNL